MSANALRYEPVDEETGEDLQPAPPEDAGEHNVMTCDKRICVETRRIMAGRGRAQKHPK